MKIFNYNLIEANTKKNFGYYTMDSLKKYLGLSENDIDRCIKYKLQILQHKSGYCEIIHPNNSFSIPGEQNCLKIYTGIFFENEE